MAGVFITLLAYLLASSGLRWPYSYEWDATRYRFHFSGMSQRLMWVL